MIKLYYAPGACSLSPHIALLEAQLPFELVRVNLKAHTLPDGSDFYAINPKGYVPVLEMASGERLTEGSVLVQYIADQAPGHQLAPAAGTPERYRLMEWLSFIGTELHKGMGPLFNPTMPEDAKAISRTKVSDRLKWVDSQLAGKTYLQNEAYSVADGYLFNVASWGKHVNVDISGMPNLVAFMARMMARPTVQAAMKAEGLLG
jgi:glutathione S-transferase